MTSSTPRIIRAHTIPVRLLSLTRLENEIRDYGLTAASRLFSDTESLGGVARWATVSRQDALHAVWKKYLETIRSSLLAFRNNAFGDKAETKLRDLLDSAMRDEVSCCRLRAYLSGLADIIAYAMRYPLYRDPLIIRSHQSLGILAPHYGLVVARLSAAIRALVFGKKGCDQWLCLDEGGKDCKQAYRELANVYQNIVAQDPSSGGIERIVWSSIIRPLMMKPALLEAVFYAAPADTRPGYNTSSLLEHLLLVGGAAASILKTLPKAKCRLDKEVARLAGLLHDVGKPLNPAKHVEMSIQEARRLLEGLIPEPILEAILELIKYHHARTWDELHWLKKLREAGFLELEEGEVLGVLKCADQLTSRIDRLWRFIEFIIEREWERDTNIDRERRELYEEAYKALQALGEKLREHGVKAGSALAALRQLYSSSYQEAAEARRAYEQLLGSSSYAVAVRASEALAKLLGTIPDKALRETLAKQESRSIKDTLCSRIPKRAVELANRLALVVVDIGGIQASLAESFKMRSLAGLSLLVDYLTLVLVPAAIVVSGGSPEGIVFSGGGTVQALLVPSSENASTTLYENISRIIRADPLVSLSLHGVRIRIGIAPLTGHEVYAHVVADAYKNLVEMTEGQGAESSTYKWLSALFASIARPCSSCGYRPASIKLNEEEYLCPICAARYAVSDILGYSRKSVRMKTLRELGLDIAEDMDSFDPLRVIAGASEEAQEANYAIIKSDGNLAGALMSSSLTPATYFDKSIRLDLATKKAITKIISLLDRDRVRHLLGALVLGFMYAGGDDSLIILPAKIALPVAMMLMYEFSAELGFLTSLSVGLVAAPVKHNIWWSLDAATTLLDDVAKTSARPETLRALRLGQRIESAGYIAFDYSDGWGLNGPRARRRHESLVSLRLTAQPLPLLANEGRLGLLGLVSSALGIDAPVLPRSGEDDYRLEEALVKILYSFAEGKARQALSDMHALFSRIIQRAGGLPTSTRSPPTHYYEKLVLALLSGTTRLGDVEDKQASQVAQLLAKEYISSKVLPIHDFYLVYKYARGD